MSIKGIVFDMDGVLRIGNKSLEGSENILIELKKRGIKSMIVTNECRFTVSELKDDLDELGIQIPQETKFYTAALSAKDYLKKKLLRFPKNNFKIGIIGELGLFSTISTLTRFNNFEIEDDLDNINETDRLYLVIGTVNRIKINHLDKILKWDKRGAKIIKTCVDSTDPSSKGDFNLGMPSHMLHMVNYNVKTKSYSTGKPHPIHKEKIMETLEIDNPNEILFIGDTIYSDIRLAEESGFRSCLILTGNSNRETINSYVTEPDYIINNLSEIFNLI